MGGLPVEKTVQKAVLQAPVLSCMTKPRKTKSPCFTGFCDSVELCSKVVYELKK
jgi:hypothetical protein